MKKILTFSLLLALSIGLFVVASNSQNSSLRKQKREQARQVTLEKNKAAIAEQTFCFYPLSYALPYSSPVNINNTTQYYFDFYPQDINMCLPIELNMNSKFVFENSSASYTDFNVKDMGDGINFVITAQLRNISNNNMNGNAMNFNDQNVNLGVHMTVNLQYGNASLTLTPDFAAATTYQGHIITYN